MRKLVIIPTYNEKENISAMIDKVFSLPEPFDMLVIDDGSPDGTALGESQITTFSGLSSISLNAM